MKKITIFLIILITTILFAACSTQQRIVNTGCNCPTSRHDNWNTYSQGGWGNQFWGWNNNMMWGGYPFGILPRYYIQPNRIQPQEPTRYERRTTIGERPSRVSTDNIYPNRTQNIPRLETRPYQQNTQPSRVQQRTTTPTNNQPTRSRVQNN